MLRNLEGSIERHHCFNLFVPERLRVSLHCSAYVPVSHNILKNLNVNILFAHARAESVSQDMSANLWKITRLTILFPRFCILFLVVGGRDALDRVVDKGLRINLPIVIEENEVPLLSAGQISYNDSCHLPPAYRAGHGLHE